MIIQNFDNGWGKEYPAKQLEISLLSKWVSDLDKTTERIVVINSVWYTDDYHNTIVIPYLNRHKVDRIVLVAMLDAAIPKPEWFRKYATVSTIGYYNSKGFVDYWALFLGKEFVDQKAIDLLRVDKIEYAYMCLNRKPHWHRKKLYNSLVARQLVDKGLVTMGSDGSGPPIRAINESINLYNLAPNSTAASHGIPNDISTLGDIRNWQKCFLNIVTETVFDVDQNYFVSEKIYKPIVGLRPFLVFDPTGAVNWLTPRGLLNYTTDFTDITDLDLTVGSNIPEFLETLCNQSHTYWQHKLATLQEKTRFNKNQFLTYIKLQQEKLSNDFYSVIE